MSFYDNRCYYFTRLFLSIIGQWPQQSRLKGNVMFAITLFFICSLTALEFSGLITGITDLSIVMENASPLLINSLIFVKLANYIYNKSKMKELMEHIEKTWKMLQVGPENEILRNYAEQSRNITFKYTVILLSGWIFYTSPPLIISEIYSFFPNQTYTAKFLYRLEHVLDVNKYFNLLMLHAFISCFYIVAVPIAVDCFFVICIQHACALFDIVRYNMECIRHSDIVILEPNIAEDKAYHIIINCVAYHNRALKYSELLSSAYAASYFFLIGNVIISLSFSAAEVIMVDCQIDEIIRIVGATLAQLTHVYYLSATSQLLIDHSSGLHRIIYSSNWYTISLRSRKLINFMLLRTIKPCQIKAGKVYVMSMENFSSILQVSLSYFTMLTSLQ